MLNYGWYLLLLCVDPTNSLFNQKQQSKFRRVFKTDSLPHISYIKSFDAQKEVQKYIFLSVFTSQNPMGVTRNYLFKNNNEHTERVFLTLTSVFFDDIYEYR